MMADLEILFGVLAILIALFMTIFMTKSWIRVARKVGLVGKDMNKFGKKEVVEAGGISVVTAFSFSVLLYIFFKTFYLQTDSTLIYVFALLTSVLLACFIGFIDDILGWKVGLRKWQKPLLTIPISIPLVVINAGTSTMGLPFIGAVDFGILFPLLIVPLGIVGAANGFNMLAGYNGLEAGFGVIILSTLGYIAMANDMLWLALIAFLAVASLLGFLFYNRYPSRVFPGDTLTYTVGALIAIVAVLGNMEKAALILFFPFLVEFSLKLRSRFRAEVFGLPRKDGTIKPRCRKVFSLTHLVLRFGPKIFGRYLKEYEVVGVLLMSELVFVFLALYSVGLVWV
jgi:UDP-N-acetylglucosamine--dolichyl-phosphate N-acetylglucosaminephosphotransferase